MKPLILSLCDHSGEWSRPYLDNGYEVIRVDLQDGQDVRTFKKLDVPVHGILAAPPCTHFALSGARWWAEKGEESVLEGLAVVDACLRIILIHRPVWWVLENPVGRLRDYLGPPAFRFDPCDYGDPYTKRTLLWGNFTPPVGMFCPSARDVAPILGSLMHVKKRSMNDRSKTSSAFARAFYEANP